MIFFTLSINILIEMLTVILAEEFDAESESD